MTTHPHDDPFSVLVARIGALGRLTRELSLAWGDQPAEEVALVERLTDLTDDLSASIREAGARAEEMRASTEGGREARRALIACHAEYQNLVRQYLELVAYDRLRDLMALAERGREWAAWITSTRLTLDRYPDHLVSVGAAILACWEELFSWSGSSGVTIRATNIGQQKLIRARGTARGPSAPRSRRKSADGPRRRRESVGLAGRGGEDAGQV